MKNLLSVYLIEKIEKTLSDVTFGYSTVNPWPLAS